ncbi:MAG: N-acetylneuraminate synthase [Lachnospiraceae bacterium]|jgi:N-acetylneuraminate synthase|nr:N-acetylneuraminate synthase [Lachnospiraceae bacterium]MDE6980110.1 N-acetylneuraminate synthase [Lachnospiraceae bacterium]
MEHVTIIAEAGVNHNGDLSLAKKMVDAAKSAGADYIKFQTFQPEKLVSKFAGKAEYQKKNTGEDETQLQMLRKLALTKEDFVEIKKYCDEVDMKFISTPFDLGSIEFLEKFDMDFWKIPSGEVTNLPYLEAIGKTGRKVIMSTGMCNLEEILNAVRVLENCGTKEIILLHCNTQYPTPYEDVNLSAMKSIAEASHKKIGYSDHTPGIEVSLAAIALGAVVIEKHFTLDKNMPGPDHKASLETGELEKLVCGARNIEKAIGNGKKELTPSEKENVAVARKSIIAKKDIKAGEPFTADHITTKRPGTGISPMKWYDVIGKTAPRDFKEDEMIEL